MLVRDERGSAAIEAAVGLPAFVLFVGLIIFGGRTAMTHSAVESAAADAARSASIARTSSEARTDAKAGSVAATVECRLDLADLSVPGIPGSRLIEATISSPLDTWRERG